MAKDVQVPDLKGKTQADAENTLSDVGLVGVAASPEETTEVSPGQVFKQSIEAGTTVKEGEKVAFTVAAAPAEVTVPDVAGKTHDEAKKAIESAGLVFDYTSAHDANVPEGKVISQSAAAGTKLQKGSTLSVVISLGAEPAPNVNVPDVTGMVWEEAKAALKNAGLEAAYNGDKSGYVSSQDIAAGTSVAAGTTITVELASPDPGQNPIMNFIGNYQADRATALVEADGDTGGKVTIDWGGSATDGVTWVLTGTFDPNTLKLTYKKGVKTEYSYEGKKKTEETIYSNGTGTITFNDKKATFTWKDDKEDAGKGLTFNLIG